MNDMELIVDNYLLYKIITGSHLYGTNTENSDNDYSGVFLEPFEYIASPFKNIEEINLSVPNKDVSGKNTFLAVDVKYYGLKRFIKLVSQCNPNIIEFLFVPDNKILYLSNDFKSILDNRELFLTQEIARRFMGYAFEQEKKMYIRSENFTLIHQAWKSLKEEYPNLPQNTPIMKTKTADKYLESTRFLHQHNPDNAEYLYKCGDLQFGTTLHIKKVMKMLSERIQKASHRTDMILHKGYDYKFASHVVRLLGEGYQLMTEHTITFPIINVDDVIDIKRGLYTIDRVKEIIDNWKEKFRYAEERCDLPPKGSNLNKIEQLTWKIQRNWYE